MAFADSSITEECDLDGRKIGSDWASLVATFPAGWSFPPNGGGFDVRESGPQNGRNIQVKDLFMKNCADSAQHVIMVGLFEVLRLLQFISRLLNSIG